MKHSPLHSLALAALLLSLSSAAVAHHAAVQYDPANALSLKATVTKVEWANPHVLIFFDAVDARGRTQNWQATTAGPGRLIHLGWTAGTLKPGDRITLTGMPDKSGYHEVWLIKVALSYGRELDLHEPRVPHRTPPRS